MVSELQCCKSVNLGTYRKSENRNPCFPGDVWSLLINVCIWADCYDRLLVGGCVLVMVSVDLTFDWSVSHGCESRIADVELGESYIKCGSIRGYINSTESGASGHERLDHTPDSRSRLDPLPFPMIQPLPSHISAALNATLGVFLE